MTAIRWTQMAIGLAAGTLLFSVGCGGSGGGGGGDKAQATAAATSPHKTEAAKVWTDRCVRCHGKKGEGNGPDSGTLDPKPRNFKDAEWQGSITDEHIEKIIVGGGEAVGKSNLMPGNPDLQGKPEVVAAVKDIVRAFAGRK